MVNRLAMWVELAGFAGIMAVGQMVPGPDWVLVTRGALAKGFRFGIWTATGIACGLMVHAAVAVAGLSLYLRQFETVWTAVRWLAAGYLLWIAFQILRCGKPDGTPGSETERSCRPFLQGLLCNLLNGKVCLLLAAVCAGYLQGNHAKGWPVMLWAVVVIQGWIIWVVWAALLQLGSVRSGYARWRRWLDTGFAGGLLLVAARLMAGW